MHAVNHAPDAEGGDILYRFRTGGFSFVWHDTSGPLVEDAPQTFDAFKALRPVDLQVGAIQGFNQITNGLRDPRRYIEALAPKTFIPAHHDDWLIGITSPGEGYRQPLADELARMPAELRPTVRFITDPGDYLRPMSFKLALADPRLVRRCSAHRLRVRLDGETDLVSSVRFALDRRRYVDDRRAPFAATFGRAALRQTRSQRLRATVIRVDGVRSTLRRPRPRC
jgi:hypothetical protein